MFYFCCLSCFLFIFYMFVSNFNFRLVLYVMSVSYFVCCPQKRNYIYFRLLGFSNYFTVSYEIAVTFLWTSLELYVLHHVYSFVTHKPDYGYYNWNLYLYMSENILYSDAVNDYFWISHAHRFLFCLLFISFLSDSVQLTVYQFWAYVKHSVTYYNGLCAV